MADKQLSKAMHELSSAISEVLGKIFRNHELTWQVNVFGFFFATSNMILLVLYTIFMFLNTVDVYTGKFSHNKVVFDRWSGGVTCSFAFALLFWFAYFYLEDHGGIGTLNCGIPFKYKVLVFIGFECVIGILLLIFWLLYRYVFVPLAKFWVYLNRWQQ